MRRLTPPEVPLFLLVFGVCAYFYQGGGWNQNSRFALTRAVVEQGTLSIDAYHESTGDKAQRGGRWYSDKAPGVSLMSVPAYAVVHAVRPGAVVAGSYLATVTAVGLPSALAAVLLFRLGLGLGLGAAWSAAVTVAWALATLALPYSTVLYGHQTAAALGLAAFAWLHGGRRPAGAGFALGLAVAVDYTSLLLAAALAAYAAARGGWRALARVALGALAPALALLAYHAAAFGHPLALPYHFVLQDHRRMGWFMGLEGPDPGVLWALLFGAYRGLFYSAPWLLLGLPGLVVLHRRGHRAEALTGAGVFLAYLLVNASLVDWPGGWAMGPRYLVPAVPFLAVGAMGLVLAWPPGSAARKALAGVGGTAAAVSAALMLMGTAVRPDVPLTIERPFQQYVLPSFRRGRVARSNHPIDGEGRSGHRAAWNLGHLAGLDRLPSLLPLALFAGATGAWLVRAAAGSSGARPGPHS